jgi:primosomal protein N' (replication factor Y)
MATIADVILPFFLDNTFHYLVPETFQNLVQTGMRVLVPFGKSNKLYTGIIYKLSENQEDTSTLKTIHELVDEIPIYQNYHLNFWAWISDYYGGSLGEVMLFALPNHLKIYTNSLVYLTENIENIDLQSFSEKEKKIISYLAQNPAYPLEKLKNLYSSYLIQKLYQNQILKIQTTLVNPYKPQLKSFVFLNIEQLRLQFQIKEPCSDAEVVTKALQATKSENHHKVLLYLLQNDAIEKQFLLKELQISDNILKTLEKKQWIQIEKYAVDRAQLKKNIDPCYELTENEKLFCTNFFNKLENSDAWQPVLFFHDLGNRRIAFYIEWIQKIISTGKQVLLLTPEIAFTDKFVQELQNYFQEKLGIYHSKINEDERVEIWYKVFLGVYKIVIGVRSALFLPFQSLGCIIVDEEQNPNYKQDEKNPKMNFKDGSIYFAKMLHIPVVLASQTPSIESYYFAQNGKYQLVKYFKNPLPKPHQIQIIDLKKQIANKQSIGILARETYKLIYEQKLKNKVSVLFINRKGFAPRIVCNACGHVHFCKNCDIPLTYHKQFNKLKCHYCGFQEENIYFCKYCGSNDLSYEGFGTEKVEEQIQALFPKFQIARLDSDKIRTKKQLIDFLNDVQKNKIDIVIGTQLVSKLSHFEQVELFIVLLAEMMLHIPNFRALEYTYQFLKQILNDFDFAYNESKKLIIQTQLPQHKVFEYLLTDYATYFHEQILLREELSYPPFSRLIELEIGHPKMEILSKSLNQFDKLLKNSFSEYILGPSLPSVMKLKNYYRYVYLIKMPRNFNVSKVKEHIQRAFRDFYQMKKDKNYRLIINVDPK